IIILGFSRSLLYYLPRLESREEKSTYITQTIAILTMGSILAMALYALMGRHLGEGLGAAARGFYWRLSVFTFFMVVTDYMEVLFVAQRRPVAQSIYHATVWGLQALVVIAASYWSRDVSTIIWALAVFALARFLFGITYTHLHYPLSPRKVSLRSIRAQAAFAVPVGLAGIALLLVSQTDKFIITRFLGREAFAIYSVGAFQVPLANIIQTSIGNVTFPLMARYQKEGDQAAMRELWRRSILKTVILFFPIFVFLEVTARPFITILFTEQYADATPVFMIYMLLFLRSSVETGAIIQAFNRTVFLMVGFAIGFLVNVVLGVTLLNAMGRLGVPLATVVTMTLLGIVNLWYSARLVGSPFFKLLPVGEMAKRFSAAAAPGVILWLLYRAHPVTNVVELGIAGLLYAAMYAAVCGLTRLVTVDDLRALIGR
ncbi:MAG TPA: oligosaccharide flippase family protein, partial [Candidatus Krumholzibacteria bacterium]|nr:oligosaccharide flippase family protein [Candidatus Krumholzibacteria bacterium]